MRGPAVPGRATGAVPGRYRGAVRAQQLLLAGAGAAGVLTVVATVAAALGWWWLVVLAAMLLLGGILLVALDADRRVRALRTVVRAELAKVEAPAAPRPAPAGEDVVGAVRTLQAQYTGRLDRLQDTVEQALRSRDGRG
ncbi:hypothetical protein FB476_0015 [Ornithinimicrobium humiphilum]|uniref:Uncharacterized protein n=1 Tax=Ornithinimicrobium humiphilum TaxID=125288 RepID=A0A543KJC8_9MICO|nr:hypothetical protein FB476_0015 [Ornithinimicrobium humiphilum]